jgi:glycosyltransferase involved in cell wall biosynthesis
VAFFPDAYHEIDGVANTSRHFEAFAQEHGLPFLTVHGGAEDSLQTAGSVTRMSLGRSRIGFALDKKHDYDLAFWRHHDAVLDQVRRFNPDLVHITGPSDVGQLGALIAHRVGVPLAASWHTNVHQYAEQRASSLISLLPAGYRARMGSAIQAITLRLALRFYQLAEILFAPNQELIDLLEKGTGKPCYPMSRGVDTRLFDPARRRRNHSHFVLGYVGRLTVEKNIHLLAEIEQALGAAGLDDFRFLIVGQGAEEPWLKAHMKRAEFTGPLQGEALARAYAGMDLFVFPSLTDTYGNVVLEALASGVPALVTHAGGPRFIVQPGTTGFVASNAAEFAGLAMNLARDGERLQSMRTAARTQALSASWDAVFEIVYASYDQRLRELSVLKNNLRARPQASAA